MGKLILPNLDPIKNPWVLYCKTDLETFKYCCVLFACLLVVFLFLLLFFLFLFVLLYIYKRHIYILHTYIIHIYIYPSGNPRNRAKNYFQARNTAS